MLPSYFDYIFVHRRQKIRLGPELSPKSLSTLGPNPARKARPDLQLCSTSKGPQAEIVRFFLVFTYTWQKDVAKISRVPGA